MRGIQQILRAVEQILRAFLRQKLQKALRADPCPASEQSLKVVLAQTDVCRDLFQRWLVFIMIFKVQDCLLDAQVIIGQLFAVYLNVHSLSFRQYSMNIYYSCRPDSCSLWKYAQAAAQSKTRFVIFSGF